MRFALFVLLLAACGDEVPEDAEPVDAGLDAEPGVEPAPEGGGYCCPIDPESCNCFRNGGWIANATDRCPMICDLAPVNTSVTDDEHGCPQLTGPESCLSP